MFTATFDVTVGEYTLISLPDGLPDNYLQYREHAELLDEIAVDNAQGMLCFLAVRDHRQWPFLVVAQSYDPEIFPPKALVIPETQVLFIGAGTRLLAYKLDRRQKLWVDEADTGFWSWARYGGYVIMSAELELAAWDIEGSKKWSTFVEPPWEYSVIDDTLYLDVMGKKSVFPLASGPR